MTSLKSDEPRPTRVEFIERAVARVCAGSLRNEETQVQAGMSQVDSIPLFAGQRAEDGMAGPLGLALEPGHRFPQLRGSFVSGRGRRQ